MRKNSLSELSTSNNYYKYYLLLIVIVLLIFGNSIGNSYNMDDNLVTQHHPLTSKQEITTVIDIYTSSYYEDNIGNSYGYRPMVLLSFYLEHLIFGESPLIGHCFNLLFYGLAVLLFFRLLLSWFGEKALALAILSAVFFVLHPIHTEVVNSLKNRDEILAFLFIILAGLYTEKYLKKNAWYDLFTISVFFAFGMLSKKSVYPMVLVLPIAIILFKEVNFKQLSLITISFVLPATIIGSNLSMERAVTLTCIPLAGIFAVYYFKKAVQKDGNPEKKYSLYFNSVISWVLFVIAIRQPNYYYTILYLGVSMFVVKKNEFWTIFQLVLQLAIISIFLNSNIFSMTALFISLSYFAHSFNENKLDRKLLYLSVLTSLFFLITNFELQDFFVLLDILVFFFFISRKPLWGLLFASALCIVNIFFTIELWNIAALSFSLLYFLNSKKINHHFALISTSIILVVISVNLITPLTFTFRSINLSNYFPVERKTNPLNQIQQIKSDSIKNFMFEGRKLEYVENTLVASHTLAETIGTGFLTLGEYARLLIFPKELSFYYGYAKIKTAGFNSIGVWCAVIFYLGLILLAIWQVKKRPIITIGIVWFVLSVLLFSNWTELVAGMVGERLAFTASAGFSIFVAGIVLWIKPDFSFVKPKGTELVVFLLLLALGIRTIARNSDWKDPLTLMGHDIKHLNNSAQANNLYGTFLMKEANEKNKMSDEKRLICRKLAIEHFKKAVDIYPKFFNASFDLGRANLEIHDFQSAKTAFEHTYSINPDNILVLEELTKTSFDLKQVADIEYYGNKCIEKNPYNENIHELIAYNALINNDKEKSKAYSIRGLRYFPNNKNLGLILDESLK